MEFDRGGTQIAVVTATTYADSGLVASTAYAYRVAARDNAGNCIANHLIALRFSIHNATSGGPIVYRETQTATTNLLGLFTANIGQGTVVSGTFSTINWGTGPYFIKTETRTNICVWGKNGFN